MDLARIELERDAVIGHHAGEALGDVADRGNWNAQCRRLSPRSSCCAGASVTEVISARPLSASHSGSIFILPPTISSRIFDTSAQTSYGMCLVFSSCTEPS